MSEQEKPDVDAVLAQRRWEALERNSIRAAEAKFGVGHPRHDEAALVDEATHWYGCDSVHPDCHHPAERILLDLIADLRSEWHVAPSSDGYGSIKMKDDGWVQVAADRAETRLREVTHE